MRLKMLILCLACWLLLGFCWMKTGEAKGTKPRILPNITFEQCLAGGLASGDSVTTVAVVCGGIERVRLRQKPITKKVKEKNNE